MNCNICELKYGPVCLTLGGGRTAKTDTSCTLVKYGRTEVGDFAYCKNHEYKFGAASPFGTLGWVGR